MRQELVDRLIAHQVDLTRYSNGVAARVRALLDRVDPDLFAQLMAALERFGPDRFTTQRLDRLLAEIRTINGRAYEAVTDALVEELRGLTETELAFQVGMTRMQAGASLQLASVTAETLYGAAMSRPFQGRLLREWAESIGEQRMVRIRDAVRMGYVEGQTVGQIVQRIRGTRARGYSDGIIEIDRRHAEAVARTAISHMAGFVRDRWHEENEDIIEAVMWLSTLDSRTSNACKLRDQKRYTSEDHKPIGHRIPWLAGPGRLHWNAIPAGALITTNRGALPVELVVVGDLVLTHTGAFQPVTDKLSKRNEGGVIRAVNLESGRVLRATDDHPVLTARGWVFVGALKVGDELFRDTEGAGEVLGPVGQVVTEAKNCPSAGYESGVARGRAINLAAAAVGFKSYSNVGPREIDDVAVEVVLRNPSIVESKSDLHHLLALAHVLGEEGRKGLAELLASLLGQGAAGQSSGHSFVESGGCFRCKRFFDDAIHRHWVSLRHQLGVKCVLVARFLREAVRPMAFAGWGGATPGLKVGADLFGLGSNREPGSLRPFGKSTIRQSSIALDRTERLSVLDMVNENELAVIGKRFRHDRIVSLELQPYNSTVYDLGVTVDSSYVCNGIVVSNCRSTSIGLLKDQERLYGERAAKNADTGRGKPVEANTTYGDWLKRQSAAAQDDILGPTRGKLFRAGGLQIEDFANERGRWLTLEQLRARDAAAFERAGV